MSGFPLRISRDTFGPTLVDAWPVENPETHIPAVAFNLVFHQLAGMNAAHPVRYVLVAEYDGISAMTTLYQAEAWNPNNDQAHPVLARSGTGVYTVTFAASYLDELGAAVGTQLLFASARSLAPVVAYVDRLEAYAWVDLADPLVVNVTTWESATGLAADARFVLEVA